ncbi:MAG TPA: cytochrome c oxidase subunit 3 family protein [Bryobacteraceae bacterium]|jgi:cytochrome c oxidase subunit 3
MSTSTVDLHGGHAPEGAHHDSTLQHHFATKDQQFDTSKLGMWLFLATEIMLFGVLFVAFGMSQNKWGEEFKEAHHHLQRPLGALNTIVLLISSWTMVMGVLSAKRGDQAKLKMYLSLTIACAFIFLGVKYIEYSHKFEEGLLPGKWYSYHETIPEHVKGASVFFSFYFMMTGLHGFHIFGGICVLFWMLIRASKGEFGPSYYTPIDLVGLYWHLVDLIWIYLFPLLYLIQ